MRTARITKDIKNWAEAISCEIIKAKTFKQSKHKLIGIHLLMPTQSELEDALERAERDMFNKIIIHTFDSWAPGSMKRTVGLT